jgi:hypothetical protein
MKAPAGCGAQSANIAAMTIAPKTVIFRSPKKTRNGNDAFSAY